MTSSRPQSRKLNAANMNRSISRILNAAAESGRHGDKCHRVVYSAPRKRSRIWTESGITSPAIVQRQPTERSTNLTNVSYFYQKSRDWRTATSVGRWNVSPFHVSQLCNLL